MSTHAERAAKLGYRAPTQAKPRAAAAATKTLYDGNLDLPLTNYYSRREAALRYDPEGLNAARQERRQLETFARQEGISAKHLQQALAVVAEYDGFPRSDAAKATLRAQNAEKQRLELGGTEELKAHTLRVGRVTKKVETHVPSLITRVRKTGASVDPRLFDALAPYGEKTS